MKKLYLFALALPLMANAGSSSKLTSNTIMQLMNREHASSELRMARAPQCEIITHNLYTYLYNESGK